MLTQALKATLYGVQLALGPNGERYVKTFIGELSGDENTKGISLMSINTDPVVFDSLNIPVDQFPCEVDIDVQIVRGGQNKMSQRVVGIRPQTTSMPSSSPKKSA